MKFATAYFPIAAALGGAEIALVLSNDAKTEQVYQATQNALLSATGSPSLAYMCVGMATLAALIAPSVASVFIAQRVSGQSGPG